jgi:hypothetical protein
MCKLTLQQNEPLSCLVQINHHCWSTSSHCASSQKAHGTLSLFNHCPLCFALLKIEMVLGPPDWQTTGWHAGSVDLLASKGRLLAGSGIDKLLPSTHATLLQQTLHPFLTLQAG